MPEFICFGVFYFSMTKGLAHQPVVWHDLVAWIK